jgi:hypothetical protein
LVAVVKKGRRHFRSVVFSTQYTAGSLFSSHFPHPPLSQLPTPTRFRLGPLRSLCICGREAVTGGNPTNRQYAPICIKNVHFRSLKCTCNRVFGVDKCVFYAPQAEWRRAGLPRDTRAPVPPTRGRRAETATRVWSYGENETK